MKEFPHVKLITVLSCFPLLIGSEAKNANTVVEINQGASDGGQYLEKIINGEKVPNNAGVLMFTAPYKLCEGGCNGSDNFVMSFPLYVGKKAMDVYKKMFNRDHKEIHSMKPHAPFTQKTERTPTTPCMIANVNLKYTIIISTPEEVTTPRIIYICNTTTTQITCPLINKGDCIKRKKQTTPTPAESIETTTTHAQIDITENTGLYKLLRNYEPEFEEKTYNTDDSSYIYNYQGYQK